MKLATYEFGGRRSFGVLLGENLFDIPSAWPDGPRSLLEALELGDAAMRNIADLSQGAKKTIPTANVRLLAPLPAPPKLIGLAVNYVEHHREFDRGHDLPDDPRRNTTPRPFLMPTTAVANPGDVIPWPCTSRDIDHEVELAVVIGRRCKDISPEQAKAHVAGYTIANDLSARTATFAEGRVKRPKDDFFDWLHGKWPDGFCPLGPCLVTADEIGDPHKLRLQCLVNGEIRQDAVTSQMMFGVYDIVSFVSRLMTLVPGDVIATGTPSGVGMATGKLLRGGDVVTCRIEKIGELTNTIGAPPEAYYVPCKP